MRYTKEIVTSLTEPNKENLWLTNGKLKFYGPKGWTLINGAFDATPLYDAVNTGKNKVSESFKIALQEAINEGRITYMYSKDKQGYTFKVMIVFATLDPSGNLLFLDVNNFDGSYRFSLNLTTNEVRFENTPISTISEGGTSEMIAFSLNDTAEDKQLNLRLAADILFDKVEAVLIKGTRKGVEYNTIGIYHDGYITALQKNQYIVFNVSFQDGSITIETDTKIDGLLPYVILKVGNDEETMQYNIEHLPDGEFFMHMEYGYGVGTFQPGNKGFAHITNAYGNELFYTISKDGAIMPDRDYVKPNEPYTVILKAEQLNGVLDEVTASQVSKAGEIVVEGLTGPITYTRTADSAKGMIYFTDNKKDGTMTLLTYIVSTKTLNYSELEMSKATPNKVGGITQGNTITDATNDTLLNTVNNLLAQLRNSGVISK